MITEHRLAFTLYHASDLESEAIRCLVEKQDVSKKSHEYCRRLISVGVTVLDVFSKIDHPIEQVESAIEAKNSGRCSSEEFVLRLTFVESETFYSPESEVRKNVVGLHRTAARKEYLRKLLLYGYWFETLPSRNKDEVINIFPIKEINKEAIPLEVRETKSTTQTKLGGLMPSCVN